jgi:hypothetical protein
MNNVIFQFDPDTKPDVKGQQIFGRRRSMNDVVYTPHDLALTIIQHFKPTGKQLDPCRGDGAFYDQLTGDKDWCELADNKDFLNYNEPVDWIVSNPPWSSAAYRNFAYHAFEIADNVIFLIRLHNALGTYARHRAYLERGHGLKEVLVVSWPDGWPQEGFILGAFHWQRGWSGGTTWSYASRHSRMGEVNAASPVAASECDPTSAGC